MCVRGVKESIQKISQDMDELWNEGQAHVPTRTERVHSDLASPGWEQQIISYNLREKKIIPTTPLILGIKYYRPF